MSSVPVSIHCGTGSLPHTRSVSPPPSSSYSSNTLATSSTLFCSFPKIQHHRPRGSSPCLWALLFSPPSHLHLMTTRIFPRLFFRLLFCKLSLAIICVSVLSSPPLLLSPSALPPPSVLCRVALEPHKRSNSTGSVPQDKYTILAGIPE